MISKFTLSILFISLTLVVGCTVPQYEVDNNVKVTNKNSKQPEPPMQPKDTTPPKNDIVTIDNKPALPISPKAPSEEELISGGTTNKGKYK